MKHLEEIIKSKEPTLVAFAHADKAEAEEVKQLVEELRTAFAGKANIVHFDNPFNNQVSRHFRITAYPTYILFKDGEELMRESGKKTLDQLSEFIARAL